MVEGTNVICVACKLGEIIKNTQIVEELALPPVKIHCSVLAEDAIKAAIKNYKDKRGTQKPRDPDDLLDRNKRWL